ncbi:hypothetical protein CR513_44414, partial [Mucuna pruriens]
MGLTPTALGKTLPSHTYKPFASQLSPFSSSAPSSSVAPILQLSSFLDLGPPTIVTVSRNSSKSSSLIPLHLILWPSLLYVPTSTAPAATKILKAFLSPIVRLSLSTWSSL